MILEKLTPYFIGVIVLFIIAEAIYSIRRNKKLYDKHDTFVNIVLGVLGVVTRITFKGANLAIWFALYSITPLKIDTSISALALLFLLNEFVYYWFHRWSHTIPFCGYPCEPSFIHENEFFCSCTNSIHERCLSYYFLDSTTVTRLSPYRYTCCWNHQFFIRIYSTYHGNPKIRHPRMVSEYAEPPLCSSCFKSWIH